MTGTARIFDAFLERDFTELYAVLVWAAVMLAVTWSILLREDPANKGLPDWDLRLRTIGVAIIVFGLLLSVLFGGDRRWAPWPTMLVVAFGVDFYLAAAIFTGRRRHKLRKFLEMGRRPVGTAR